MSCTKKQRKNRRKSYKNKNYKKFGGDEDCDEKVKNLKIEHTDRILRLKENTTKEINAEKEKLIKEKEKEIKEKEKEIEELSELYSILDKNEIEYQEIIKELKKEYGKTISELKTLIPSEKKSDEKKIIENLDKHIEDLDKKIKKLEDSFSTDESTDSKKNA